MAGSEAEACGLGRLVGPHSRGPAEEKDQQDTNALVRLSAKGVHRRPHAMRACAHAGMDQHGRPLTSWTCQRTYPFDKIRWTVPEGGGRRYKRM
jgi:hypothetical protein